MRSLWGDLIVCPDDMRFITPQFRLSKTSDHPDNHQAQYWATNRHRQQRPESVGGVKVPPAGFNAQTASERKLLSYGLPLRPDAEKHPTQAALWDSVAKLPLRFVRPTLVPLPDHPRSRIRDHVVPDTGNRLFDAVKSQLRVIGIPLCWIFVEKTSNWSGAYVKRPASEPLVTVTGQWTVPNVSPPSSALTGTGFKDGTYICAVWVGLDGDHGTTDVLQAGTSSVVTVKGGQ